MNFNMPSGTVRKMFKNTEGEMEKRGRRYLTVRIKKGFIMVKSVLKVEAFKSH